MIEVETAQVEAQAQQWRGEPGSSFGERVGFVREGGGVGGILGGGEAILVLNLRG